MPVTVQGPDSKKYQFPDGTTKEQAIKYFQSKGIRGVTVGAAPPTGSLRDIGGRILTARDTLINNLPNIGGFIGGLVGGAAGAETGPGAVVSAGVGAAAGGGLGEDIKQSATEFFHPEDRKMGGMEAGARIAGAAASQGAQEVVGRGMGAVTGAAAKKASGLLPDQIFEKYPLLKTWAARGEPQTAQQLTAAAAEGGQAGRALENISYALDDLKSEITKLPEQERTVGGFLKAVNSRKDAMNAESGAAMMPINAVQTIPTGIANDIMHLIKPDMDAAERRYIRAQAMKFNQRWTYRELDSRRNRLASQLARHKTKGGVAQYTAENGDLQLAVDNAILDGLRDTVYPEMDRAAGKPIGYFENLKGRQSALINLEAILDDRIRYLSGKQATEEATSGFGKNVSAYMHVGSIPRAYVHGLKEMISPTRSLNEASEHVQKAFQPTLDSLPYQLLFSGELRTSAPGTGLEGPKKKKLDEVRASQQP